jgi:hypothetical protein
VIAESFLLGAFWEPALMSFWTFLGFLISLIFFWGAFTTLEPVDSSIELKALKALNKHSEKLPKSTLSNQ